MVTNLERVAQQLQQRAVSMQRWCLGLDVLLGALLAALIIPILVHVFAWPLARLPVYAAVTLLAGGTFAVLAWRVRVDRTEVLARADRVLKLHETLSTAYEYQEQHASNPFLPGLLAAAEKLALRVKFHQVLPRRFPRRLWALPLLLVAIIASPSLEIPQLPFANLATSEVVGIISREGQRLEHWGRDLEDLAKRERLDRSRILARQMQQLGQRLQREAGQKMPAAERISTLAQYLQRLQQELHERALLSETSRATFQDVLASNTNVKQELRDILHLLQNDTAPRDLAAAAEQSVLRLRRQVGQNAQLEQLLNMLRTGDLEAARELLQEVLQQQQAAEEGEQLDRARRALEYAARAIQRQTAPDASAGQVRSPQGGSSGPEARGPGEAGMDLESLLDMDDGATPGGTASGNAAPLTQPVNPPHIRESDQPPSHVALQSGEGASHMSYVRALPLQNEAHVPFTQVVVQYQHAAEEALTQERMPRAYREQIKQYFLSLGMVQ